MEISCEEYGDVIYGIFMCYSVLDWNICTFKKTEIQAA